VRYLCLIYADEKLQTANVPGPDGTPRKMNDAYAAYTKMVIDRGVLRGGDALQPVATATSIRVRNGERMIVDGPFAETKEQLGGFYLLDCKDLDEAIELAGQIPGAAIGTVEVRPVFEFN
jgi:hypothetical protein